MRTQLVPPECLKCGYSGGGGEKGEHRKTRCLWCPAAAAAACRRVPPPAATALPVAAARTHYLGNYNVTRKLLGCYKGSTRALLHPDAAPTHTPHKCPWSLFRAIYAVFPLLHNAASVCISTRTKHRLEHPAGVVNSPLAAGGGGGAATPTTTRDPPAAAALPQLRARAHRVPRRSLRRCWGRRSFRVFLAVLVWPPPCFKHARRC